MSKVVTEMYECDGVCKGVKYILSLYDDKTVKLVFYNGTVKFDEPNVHFKEVAPNGIRVEYGTSSVLTSLPFKNVLDGKLDKSWTKIK